MRVNPKAEVATSSTTVLVDKAIVVVDMVGYSTVGDLLEENLGSSVTAELNRQIEEFIEIGLSSIYDPGSFRIVARTGDGAVLMFDDCNEACGFAENVHKAAQDRNSKKREVSARRVFRIGIAFGEVTCEHRQDDQHRFAGMAIRNAVRLEAAAADGQIVVDHGVYEHLSYEFKVRFGQEETLRGKRDEVFRARCSRLQNEVPFALKAPQFNLTRRTALLGLGGSAIVAAGGWYAWLAGREHSPKDITKSASPRIVQPPQPQAVDAAPEPQNSKTDAAKTPPAIKGTNSPIEVTNGPCSPVINDTHASIQIGGCNDSGVDGRKHK